MSGHNKWSKIKHKKAATDAQKSKKFSMLAKLITVESKKADGNVDSPGLRAAIEKARSENMPKDNIDRAVKKGASKDAASLEAVIYEAYGPGGSALIIEGVTDNKNRTVAEVKHALTKQGSSLAQSGAASWAFTKEDSGWVPNTTVELSDADGEKLSTLIEVLEELDDVGEVYTNAT